ncbi:MAG: nitrate ABC transporter substrate-binding protein [Clostridioides sp.]|jgi:ABC-type nitrate/sulfonate/bicarbonate transport system permease component|nr:nitrate ABC transporter substrate-binding protein [Clostridioides sp.]
MVRAQTMMKTEQLVALMCMAAIVGFTIDLILKLINKILCRWKFEV